MRQKELSILEKICEVLDCQPGEILEYKKINLDYLNRGECMMKKKYLLASTPIFLGVVCLIIYSLIGSSVAPDGTLEEPFFLILLSYLFVFVGIISVLFVAIISMFKKNKHN